MDRVTFNNGDVEILTQEYSRKKYLMDRLVEMTQEVGHELTFREVEAEPEMPKPNEFADPFGSFTKAAKKALQKVRAERAADGEVTLTDKEWTDDELLDMLEKVCDEVGPEKLRENDFNLLRGAKKFKELHLPEASVFHERFGPKWNWCRRIEDRKEKSEVKKMAKRTNAFDREKALESLKKFYGNHGRMPTQTELLRMDGDDMREYPGFRSPTCMVSHLGNMSGWPALVGVGETSGVSETSGSSVLSEKEANCLLETIEAVGGKEEVQETARGDYEPAPVVLERAAASSPITIVNEAFSEFIEKLQKIEIAEAAIDIVIRPGNPGGAAMEAGLLASPIKIHLEF